MSDEAQYSFNNPDLMNDYWFLPTSTTPNDHDPPGTSAVADDDNDDENRRQEAKMKERHRRVNELLVEKVLTTAAGEGSSSTTPSSSTKKLQHNAKERMRRMRLNASYLALRALLPESRRSKKRWTAPAIVDKVLKHIPELENEIENLKQIMRDKVNYKEKQSQQILHLINDRHPQNLTVSVNQIRAGEAILQICKEPHYRDDDDDNVSFSRFLENMEAQQVCIKSASTLSICENRICYQLHIQWNESTHGPDYIKKLRNEETAKENAPPPSKGKTASKDLHVRYDSNEFHRKTTMLVLDNRKMDTMSREMQM